MLYTTRLGRIRSIIVCFNFRKYIYFFFSKISVLRTDNTFCRRVRKTTEWNSIDFSTFGVQKSIRQITRGPSKRTENRFVFPEIFPKAVANSIYSKYRVSTVRVYFPPGSTKRVVKRGKLRIFCLFFKLLQKRFPKRD